MIVDFFINLGTSKHIVLYFLIIYFGGNVTAIAQKYNSRKGKGILWNVGIFLKYRNNSFRS